MRPFLTTGQAVLENVILRKVASGSVDLILNGQSQGIITLQAAARAFPEVRDWLLKDNASRGV